MKKSTFDILLIKKSFKSLKIYRFQTIFFFGYYTVNCSYEKITYPQLKITTKIRNDKRKIIGIKRKKTNKVSKKH